MLRAKCTRQPICCTSSSCCPPPLMADIQLCLLALPPAFLSWLKPLRVVHLLTPLEPSDAPQSSFLRLSSHCPCPPLWDEAFCMPFPFPAVLTRALFPAQFSCMFHCVLPGLTVQVSQLCPRKSYDSFFSNSAFAVLTVFVLSIPVRVLGNKP